MGLGSQALLVLRSELPEGCQAVPEGVEWKHLVYFGRDEGLLWSLRKLRKGSGPTSNAWFPGTEKHKACGIPWGNRCVSLPRPCTPDTAVVWGGFGPKKDRVRVACPRHLLQDGRGHPHAELSCSLRRELFSTWWGMFPESSLLPLSLPPCSSPFSPPSRGNFTHT